MNRTTQTTQITLTWRYAESSYISVERPARPHDGFETFPPMGAQSRRCASLAPNPPTGGFSVKSSILIALARPGLAGCIVKSTFRLKPPCAAPNRVIKDPLVLLLPPLKRPNELFVILIVFASQQKAPMPAMHPALRQLLVGGGFFLT